jgi:hypothetical protein
MTVVVNPGSRERDHQMRHMFHRTRKNPSAKEIGINAAQVAGAVAVTLVAQKVLMGMNNISPRNKAIAKVAAGVIVGGAAGYYSPTTGTAVAGSMITIGAAELWALRQASAPMAQAPMAQAPVEQAPSAPPAALPAPSASAPAQGIYGQQYRAPAQGIYAQAYGR